MFSRNIKAFYPALIKTYRNEKFCERLKHPDATGNKKQSSNNCAS
ncbi:hypothetical protein APHCRT_0734 [Anaplasma phagocytophilum str. CRT53-1]|uniref:Uncharacterized protein n=1 Tax=Anaplasma phagocytophilum str. CRT53-1 TaxID=1359157 RepID=A0A0F3Q0A5_ANAPH|nr:hypothetical protein APHCRT_0734 [Anaplasma phagocytophilum str. CRT53-1]